MSPNGTAKTEDLKAELVIIGAGGAGLAAAVSAAERGTSNIIVLEKRGAPGGASAMAVGPFAAESPAQRRQRIIANRDDLFKRAMSWAHWKINPRIVRAFIDRSGDTIRWLEEKGLYFKCIRHSVKDMPLTWHVPQGRGRAIMKVLGEECKRLGVEVLLRTQAKRLLTGAKGNVSGVLAEREGEEFRITTGSVIIATGGFGGNKELLKQYCPNYHDNMERTGLPNMGDGLVMATEIGAATEGLGFLLAYGPTAIPRLTKINVGTEPNIVKVPFWGFPWEPYMLWVNKKGKRFIDETSIFNPYESQNAVVQQPDNICYFLFDNKMVQIITEQGLAIGGGGGDDPFRESPQRGKLPGLEKALRVQADKGNVQISDSWDGIADWIGADHKVLKATIDEYNAACNHGYDPVFAKDRTYLLPLRTPPYYAIRGITVYINTMGGIKINENMEVLDKQDNPIPGLYAGGVDTGGWTSDTYCALLPGTAFGFALNSGRIAGENAAKFVLNK